MEFDANEKWRFPIAEARKIAMLHSLLPPAAAQAPGKILSTEEQIQLAAEAEKDSKTEPYRPGAMIGAGEMPHRARKRQVALQW